MRVERALLELAPCSAKECSRGVLPHAKSWLPLGLLATFFISNPVLAQVQQPKLSEVLARAQKALLAKDFARASDEYRQAIRIAPSAEMYEKLGLTRFMANDFVAGRDAFEEAVRREPERWTSHLFLGICLYRTNRFREALPRLERALELNPQHNETQFWVGSTHRALGNHNRAAVILHAALEKEPENVDILYTLAQSYLDVATLLLKRLGPHDPEDKRRQALDEQYQLRSDLLERNESWQQSVRRLEDLEKQFSPAANESAPGAESLYVLHRTYSGLGQLMARRIWALQPDSYRSHQLLGQAHEGNEDYVKALEEYHEALRLAPEEPGLHYAIGHVYWQTKRFEEAAAEMEKELALNPQHASANYVLGHIFVYRREFEKAVLFLQRTIAANPGHIEARKQLGKVYSLMNNQEAALRELEAAVELDPKDSSARYLMATVYRKLGFAEKAKKELEIFNELYAQEHQHQDTVLIPEGEEAKH